MSNNAFLIHYLFHVYFMFIEACFGLDRLKSAGSNQDNGFHRSRFFIDPITETEEIPDETQTSHDIYVSRNSYAKACSSFYQCIDFILQLKSYRIAQISKLGHQRKL